MTQLRALLMSLLAVALVATGAGIGMARGAMAADGQLCSVTGPAPVVLAHDGLPLFDAEGAPVTLDRSACLDCLVVAFDLPPRAPVPAAPAVADATPLLPTLSVWSPSRAAPGGQARAPPRAA
ncbi:hypothetical protein [Roseicyclus persicicus]|uniref:DUF2946 domain-containing protein n=1 Tax=Roseicyclus persicicus TaxID=2650661 RepID=A0A7X6GVZ2_9RHOB|nr:hypothetical protein [Roseibacterium persicicum]NKX43416.1 hypothetical protein [Roseibacterium persicicum]